MNYYDEDFKPWSIVEGKCVVADESEWGKVGHVTDSYFDKVYLHNPGGAKIGEYPKRPIVKVPTDIFEDVEGPVVNRNGLQYWKDGIGDWFGDRPSAIAKRQTTKDLLTRTLQTIDATPHVDYLLMTQRPELVRDKWGWEWRRGDLNTYGAEILEDKRIVRPNVILATYVETQADLERLVPELLKCHDLCKGLAVVCNPKEKLELWPFCYGPCPNSDHISMDPETGMYECCSRCEWSGHNDEMVIDLIIAEGNEHPMHPDHVRSLRDQCKDANVEFDFAGWGEWVPISDFGKANSWTRTQLDPVLKGEINGQYAGEYETLYKWPETHNNPCMIRGKERSGRLLDGVEHNGRL